MNGWFNPDGWVDLLSQILLIAGALSIAVVPSWFAARNHRSIRDIKDQVVNGHADTNLRNDLDRAIAAINDLGNEVRGLRTDLLNESHHRRTQISDLAEELDHRTGKRRRL